MAALPPAPQPAPTWHQHSPESLLTDVKAAIVASRSVQDRVGALPAEQATFENVVKALADDEANMDTVCDCLVFMQHVSPDQAIRDAALEADKALRDFGIESSMRLDVFNAVKAAQRNGGAPDNDTESKRLLDHMLRDGRRAGLDLPKEKRDEIAKLQGEIASLSVDFQKRYGEESGSLDFAKEELDGVPQSVIDGYPKKEVDGKTVYTVTFKTPDYLPLMDFCKVEATRKKALLGYEDKLSANGPTFKRILVLRAQLATLLGYETWADFKTETKMAKSAATVNDFLDDLLAKIKPIAQAEKRRLLELKREEDEKSGRKHDPTLYVWSSRYYDQLYKEKTLTLDAEEVKQYFEVTNVIKTVSEMYEAMFNVKMIKVEDAKLWHPDASQYAVWEDAGDGQATAENFLGYMHLDLFPRTNKYAHAAVWGLVPGYTKEDGTRQYPVASMVANLAKPSSTAPALMTHSDVVTFFHEYGHAWHQLLSRTKYSRFHGTHVARDFVEAPSQMLENWTWTRDQLRSISSHHQTHKPLPDELIGRIIDSELVNSALFNSRQLFFGKFDMAVHTSQKPDELDLERLWCDMRRDVSLVEFAGEYRPGYSSFAHLIGGYDAGYYGYLYSQSFAVDMFDARFKADPMSTAAADSYRREILQPGGSRDELDSLKAFLGRPPSSEAFMRKLLAGAPKL